jgi:hypothetical protein
MSDKTPQQMAKEALDRVRDIRDIAYKTGFQKGFEAGVAACASTPIEPSQFIPTIRARKLRKRLA